MKKYKTIKTVILLIIISFAVIMMIISCSKDLCPTYGGRVINSQYGNIKPGR